MYQSTFYVDKRSGTFADNLAAFGLAFVLSAVAAKRSHVRIEDAGPCFAIDCEPAMQDRWVERCRFFVGAPFLITVDRKTGKKVIKGTTLRARAFATAEGAIAVDYEDEKENNSRFFEWWKALKPEERRRAASRELPPPTRPHAQWDVFRAINPAALQAYNALMAEWYQAKDAFSDLLRVMVRMTAQTPNDLEGAEAEWKALCKRHRWDSPADATAIQLLNPTQGKGTNSTKMIWSAPNNVKGFWLSEWLKAVGLFQAGITRTISKTKDRKTYVLVPVHLGWDLHRKVMLDYAQSMAGSATAVKLDILAALRYTLAFLKHYEGARADDPELELFGRRPSDLVSGMQTAFYKSLGQSAAVMNIAAINLPRWVAPRSPSDLQAFRDALEENLVIARLLDESRGDQFELLNRYRDFMSSDDLRPFFEFTRAYSAFIMSQYDRRKYVRPFTTTTLEVIFMNSRDPKRAYSAIVQDEGFKNIAYAIRHSTVIPQARKGKGNRPVVDIRYGLGLQLTRKAAYPAEFLAELANFVHLYNGENAQLRESKREPFRKNVTTADLDAVTALVDCYGSEVICNMLVAYGYAREPFEGKAEQTPESQGEVESHESDDESETEE